MGNVQLAIIILCLIVIVLLILFGFFYSVDFLSWIQAWVQSNIEEKVSLTRLKGHYNANGYLVHSDSDIQLNCGSGSFKRFDSVDRDFKISLATTNFSEWNSCEEDSIPPQPLRPAPVPNVVNNSIPSEPKPIHITKKQLSAEESRITLLETKTSICPISRPVSSINMSNLLAQSSFPVCLSPPPSPSCPQVSSLAQDDKQQEKIVMPPFKLSGVYIQPNNNNQQVQNCEVPEENDAVMVSSALKRAVSCDSLCSDTSVALGDLEMFNVTGYLCIGLEYDSECWDLIVNVLEAKDLTGVQKKDDFLDTYVRVSLLPDAEATIQTRVYRSAGSPSYKERFLFSMNPREQSLRILCFHVYATDFLSHTLIGEGEIRLGDVNLRQPVTTWVTLTDTGQRGTEFGELLFSLSYLPTAERLTVVVVKARKLKFSTETPGEAFVKVYLMQQNKKINKKKTSVKKGEKCPIFNESMMFSVPAHTLSTIQLRLTVAEASNEENVKAFPIGHVIVGAQASGRSLSHWNQMLTALRKPVAVWHSLRK